MATEFTGYVKYPNSLVLCKEQFCSREEILFKETGILVHFTYRYRLEALKQVTEFGVPHIG